VTYCIDIDNTICRTEGNQYEQAFPYYKEIAKVNKLYDEGHTIKFFTARGSSSHIDWKKLTEQQLKLWGVKYHELIMGKPSYDVLIDDKARKRL
jgi:carbamoyl-phosphate synthase large subunit